jgi:16S rRNA (cytidine1402-2'-O)-methyltransferase
MLLSESSHLFEKTLIDTLEVFGYSNAVIARELTKKYEEIIRGELKELIDVGHLKGEIVLLVEGAGEENFETNLSMIEEVNMLIKNNFTVKDAIKQVAKNRGIPKNDVYQKYHKD